MLFLLANTTCDVIACFATQAEHLWKKQSCCCGCRVTCKDSQGRESHAGFGVWRVRAGPGRLPGWLPRSAPAHCPASGPRGRWVQGREAAGTVSRGRQGGAAWVISAADSAPGRQQLVWISTGGSSSWTTLQKHEGRILPYTQYSEPPRSSVCRAGMSTPGSSAESCTTGNRSAETPRASLHLVYGVCLSV